MHSSKLRKCLAIILILSVTTVTILVVLIENSMIWNTNSLRLAVWEADTVENATYGAIMNLTNFKFIISNDVCVASSFRGEKLASHIEAVLIITSYAGDFETRSAHRRAYPVVELSKLGYRRIFLLALINESKNTNRVPQSAIVDENERYHDILQGSFEENYKHLTYKHLMGLAFAGKYCRNVKFVFKMDHDIVVNMYKMKSITKPLNEKELFLAGYILDHMKPVREPKNKWFVTLDEYRSNVYPDFLSGWFYVTTPEVALKLYEASFTVPYFWIDDLLITGIIASQLNLKLMKLNQYFTPHSEYVECCIQQPSYNCDYVVGPINNDNNLILEFEKLSKYCDANVCKNRTGKRLLKKSCVAVHQQSSLGLGNAFVNVISK